MTTHVLMTEWVEGERLADSSAEDVSRLCGVALNAYLTMLLDTGESIKAYKWGRVAAWLLEWGGMVKRLGPTP